MKATLVKIDKNGSKHYEGLIQCDRCGGTGIYVWGAIINGNPQYAGTCFKCEGRGKVVSKWIERTPEYQAKLDAKREQRHAKRQAEIDARIESIALGNKLAEEKRLAEEEEERARKAISQYVGEIGQRIEIPACLERTATWEQRSYTGFGTETMHCHIFKDADGNVLVWKTQSCVDALYGETVMLKGTVKEHKEYDEEKQTVLTRCKVNRVGES